MNVYDMSSDGRKEDEWVIFYTKNDLAFPVNSSDLDVFFSVHKKIPIDRNTEFTPRRSKAKFGDFSNVNHNVHPVFSDRAKRIFSQHLEGLGRWIELESDEAHYWLFYITNVVDALDVAKSEIAYFSNSTKVMGIDSFAFVPEIIKDQFLFTLPQRPGSHCLVTDRFVDVVHEHQLTGFMFQRLWSSEKGPEPSGLKDWLKPRITGLEPR
jgi:hypothetical protein